MVLIKLLEKLAFTTQAVLPGRFQWSYLQNQQIQAMRQTNSYEEKIILNQQSRAEWKSKFKQTSKVHVLASRPRELCSALTLTLVEEPLRVCIPSILLKRKGPSQSKGGLVSPSHLISSQPWYTVLLSMSVQHPVLIFNQRSCCKVPKGRYTHYKKPTTCN